MIQPMLAHKFDESRIDFTKPVYIQAKLDGVRCVFTKFGAYSRNNKRFMNVRHIEMALKPFFDKNPDMILDGELYNHKLKHDFEKIISLVRKQKPTDTDRLDAQHLVQLHVYDYIDGKSENYQARMQYLVNATFYDAQVISVPACLVDSYNYARTLHGEFLEKGYEGSIIRNGNGIYKHGRSYDLMKFKDFSDTEATIIDYVVGKGKRTGTLGKFIMRDDEGIEFGCPPGKGYSYKDLKVMLENVDSFIGKRATFTYFQRTKANSYRHPLFKCVRNYE